MGKEAQHSEQRSVVMGCLADSVAQAIEKESNLRRLTHSDLELPVEARSQATQGASEMKNSFTGTPQLM